MLSSFCFFKLFPMVGKGLIIKDVYPANRLTHAQGQLFSIILLCTFAFLYIPGKAPILKITTPDFFQKDFEIGCHFVLTLQFCSDSWFSGLVHWA